MAKWGDKNKNNQTRIQADFEELANRKNEMIFKCSAAVFPVFLAHAVPVLLYIHRRCYTEFWDCLEVPE